MIQMNLPFPRLELTLCCCNYCILFYEVMLNGLRIALSARLPLSPVEMIIINIFGLHKLDVIERRIVGSVVILPWLHAQSVVIVNFVRLRRALDHLDKTTGLLPMLSLEVIVFRRVWAASRAHQTLKIVN